MAIVKAKDDIKVLMEDGRFSNFIKEHTYRCMFKGEDVYIIDEDKYGFQTDYNAAENKERDGAVSGEPSKISTVLKGGLKGCTGGRNGD